MLEIGTITQRQGHSTQQIKIGSQTTKIEEMRVHMDSFFNEILRLQRVTQIQTDSPDVLSGAPKELVNRMKSLNDTINRQNEINEKLKEENKILKQKNSDINKDMSESMDLSPTSTSKAVYSSWSKPKLISKVVTLNKALESKTSIGEARLERKDAEEIQIKQLKTDNEKLSAIAKRHKEDKENYKHKLELKEKEVQNLRRKIADLEDEVTTRIKELKAEKNKTHLYSKSKKEEKLSSIHDENTEPRRKSSKPRHIEHEIQNRAASKIQNKWRKYKDDREMEEAADVIGSAVRGHIARKKFLETERKSESDEDESEESETASDQESQQNSEEEEKEDSGIDDAAEVIQAAGRSHLNRKRFLQENGKTQKQSFRRQSTSS